MDEKELTNNVLLYNVGFITIKFEINAISTWIFVCTDPGSKDLANH